jgi:hypothetical protein
VYATYTAIASAAQAIWNAEIWASTAALLANPMTWIVVGIIALIAAIVLIATKTRWFQTIWDTVWGAIKTAFNATVSWLSGAFAWFGTLPGKFSKWFGQARDWAVVKLVSLIDWVRGLPGRLLGALASLVGSLRSRASAAFQAMRDAAAVKVVSFISWVRGIPGRVIGAIGGVRSLLYSKGRDVILGLWNGISSLGGWLYSKVANFVSNNIVGAAKDFLHIGSPSKLMAAEIGHWLPPGIAEGAENNRGVLDETMRGLVDPQLAMPAKPLTTGMAPLMGASAGGGVVLVRFELSGAEDDFHRFMRKITRVKGRGNVQTAFGQ